MADVRDERLAKASRMLAERGRLVGEEGMMYVLTQLGLETYVDVSSGKFQLRELGDLQVVSLAAALHAYAEAQGL